MEYEKIGKIRIPREGIDSYENVRKNENSFNIYCWTFFEFLKGERAGPVSLN